MKQLRFPKTVMGLANFLANGGNDGKNNAAAADSDNRTDERESEARTEMLRELSVTATWLL